VDDGLLTSLQTSTEVDVLEAKEAWSEYRLSDGTLLRIKPVMFTITRVDDAPGSSSDPVYNMKSTLVTDIKTAKPSMPSE